MKIDDDELLRVSVSEDSYCIINETDKTSALPSINKSAVNEQLDIAESFLVNSFLDFNDINNSYAVDRYFRKEFQLMQVFHGHRDYSDHKKIQLPQSLPLNMTLGNAISKRRSAREFTGDPIDFTHVATLLRAAAGVTGRIKTNIRNNSGKDYVKFRAVPSGGGLYPISLYVLPISVRKLPNGMYFYSSHEDTLYEHSSHENMAETLGCFFNGKKEMEDKRVSLVIFYAASTWASMQKYGAKGLRFILQEVGAMAQHINLSCTALGLGSLDYASYSENHINKALGFDGVQETVLHSTLIGVPG